MISTASRRAAAFTLAAALLVNTIPIASAQVAGPTLAVTGAPTAEEQQIVIAEWSRFATFFSDWDCMGSIEVRVVDRVEDFYPGRDFGPIASFYEFPPAAVVYIEHGKVNTENLVHEFAHHLDISCSFSELPMAALFREAQGLSPDGSWLTGPSWNAVPAEHFAQAVLVVFGIPSTKIAITPEGEAIIDSLGSTDRPLAQSEEPEEEKRRDSIRRRLRPSRFHGPL